MLIHSEKAISPWKTVCLASVLSNASHLRFWKLSAWLCAWFLILLKEKWKFKVLQQLFMVGCKWGIAGTRGQAAPDPAACHALTKPLAQQCGQASGSGWLGAVAVCLHWALPKVSKGWGSEPAIGVGAVLLSMAGWGWPLHTLSFFLGKKKKSVLCFVSSFLAFTSLLFLTGIIYCSFNQEPPKAENWKSHPTFFQLALRKSNKKIHRPVFNLW